MALRLACDGCDCDLKDADATTVGRYDPCVYCPTCLTTWRAYEAGQRAAHAEMVRSFEAQRRAALAILTAAGLARVPDEG